MVCALTNYLGEGVSPKLHLELSDSGAGWHLFNIDYGASGQIPWSDNSNSQWAVWNVKDGAGNYYGTIALKNSNGNSVEWGEYSGGQGYWLAGLKLTLGADKSYTLACAEIHQPVQRPPIISNLGWRSGMGNPDSEPAEGKNFWVQDYGDDLWSPDIAMDAILQATPGSSRAYPIKIVSKNPSWKVSDGIGVAFSGLWQIDMKIGSNGQGDFCETFYLAERFSPEWGPANYGDGSGHASYNSREIDIMETLWTPTGPQINLPQGGGTGWASNPADWGWKRKPNWSDVGGVPTKNFITFGCLIRDDNLWLYAYHDNDQWYSTTAIAKTNRSYEQKHPFAPYIGTWAINASPKGGGFHTAYRNFIYSPQDDPKIQGKNPADNPEAFGQPLVN